MKTIVIGLGNPILGDDGVGWQVVDEVKHDLTSPPTPLRSTPVELLKGDGDVVDVDCLSLGGISLMEHLIGYQRVILVDAFLSKEESGTIRVARLEELPNYSAFHITSVHDTSLQHAMELGRELGAKLPEDVTVVGISIKHIQDFSEELSPPVAEAVPKAAQIVMDLLAQKITIL